MDIAKTLKSYRHLRNLTGEELAKLSGTGQSTISSIERGKQSPTLETLEQICKALNINVVDFIATSSMHHPTTPSNDELLLIELYRKLTKEEKDALLVLIQSLAANRK